MLIFQLKVEFFEFAVRILNLVHPVGIEPTSTVLQTAAMTTSAKGALNGGKRRSRTPPTSSAGPSFQD